MKRSKEESTRWLVQSKHDLKRGIKLLQENDYAYACFFAEQSAQKSLKSFLLFKGKRFVITHSVGELAKEAVVFEPSFNELVDEAKRLDRHYLASRYPDALPSPAIPAESYVESEAKEAIAIAQKIFDKSQSIIK